MAFDYQSYLPAAAGLAGGALGSFFGGGENPAKAAMPYYNRMPGLISQYMQPYINRGDRAGTMLDAVNPYLLTYPGQKLNEIGQSYQQSPGLQFAIQQALQGAGHAAAAGGMAGTPQHQQQAMQVATGLANQDYNNWMQNALGLYGQGLQGERSMYGTGAELGARAGEDLASILSHQGDMAYAGQANENAAKSQQMQNLFGGLGYALPFLFGKVV